MINTITLSSDMQSLYLIDRGRAFEFPLNAVNGILIGTLNGQVTAATAPDSPRVPEEPSGTEGAQPTLSDSGTTMTRAAVDTASKTVRVPVKGSQWTIFYNRANEAFGLIGATDIDISITDRPTKTQTVFFNLAKEIVTVRRQKDSLEVSSAPKR